MGKRTDIKSILVIGSGPIVIGQACEFDYSGTQALKALKEEGYKVILVNSNPATIMTDPIYSDVTYIEPLNVETLSKIIEKERPDALLSTMGGQTALNLAMDLAKEGVLEAYNVEVIGANIESIEKAENRERFKQAMNKIGVPQPKNGYVHSLEEARKLKEEVGLPAIIRPSFTLGGSGASMAFNDKEFEKLVLNALHFSPISEVLIEESILGWKEYELEMMRDKNDNVVVVCTIENLDPVGVHTGDSITVAPSQTLTDKDYQKLRDYSLKIMREIGVDSGGSNIQYAVNPENGEVYVIEMNPRVSRSSALASKATGYPIAKIAAKLAVGYTLDEVSNDITQVTKASFEPSIDYVVTKIPRFDFAKFPESNRTLSPQMKAVGEVMSMGRNFVESFQKALCSLEINLNGLSLNSDYAQTLSDDQVFAQVRTATPQRIMLLSEALKRGMSIEDLAEATQIDPWFIAQINQVVVAEHKILEQSLEKISALDMHYYKSLGFSDHRLGQLLNVDEDSVRNHRIKSNVLPNYKVVDTCAGEFAATTNYLYSCYAHASESEPSDKKKVVILGSGPNRIGQGVEFDYCCVQASLALKAMDIESIMVNCNPETVSTDYDISDRLYFEPLSYEHVLNILEREQPDGVVLQFGGQTPLKLAKVIADKGWPILGTDYNAIDLAEDRERFKTLLQELNIKQPQNGIAQDFNEVLEVAKSIEYPLVVRPSYVLGGRAMEIVYSQEELESYLKRNIGFSEQQHILLDHYLDHSIELDVDAISDGQTAMVCGIMEHVEQAGVHSGDSSCVLPPFSIKEQLMDQIKDHTQKIAAALKVKGFLNIQFAIQNDTLYLIEVNPRASRTIPFVSKAVGKNLVAMAMDVLMGKSIDELPKIDLKQLKHFAVKSPVFPFLKFSKSDTILGPEMKSTGESMGNDRSWELAYAKAQIAAGNELPLSGTVFMSLNNNDKEECLEIAKRMRDNGYSILATRGTAKYLIEHGVPAQKVNKVVEGRPHIVDKIVNGEVDLVFNTTMGKQSVKDSYSIRRSTLEKGISYFTTLQGAQAASKAIEKIKQGKVEPIALQDMYR